VASTCEPGDRLSARAICIVKIRSKHLEKMQLSAPLIVAAALLACVAVGHAVIVERGESQEHLTKIPRRLKVSSHVFEERFILGSRFGDHTSIVRSPYPRLRFYSFCVQEEAAAD
jgi:hypothetical protein